MESKTADALIEVLTRERDEAREEIQGARVALGWHRDGIGMKDAGCGCNMASLVILCENAKSGLDADLTAARARIAALEAESRQLALDLQDAEARASKAEAERDKIRAQRDEWALLVKDDGGIHFDDVAGRIRIARTKAAALDALRQIVDTQAEDEGLWFVAHTAPEAYLQAALRALHEAILRELPKEKKRGR